MKQYRLNRLFNARSKKCFDVAIDHGFFGELAFLNSIENLQKAVKTVVAAGPDAIQLTTGQAHYLQSIPGKNKPALVLRTDIANIYGSSIPSTTFSLMLEDCVEQAVRLDAACMCVNLFEIPGAPEVTKECIQNILKLKPLSEKYSMPMMVEPLVFRPNSEKGGYMVNGEVNKIMPLVRQAVELGADIVKADPTDDAREYHKIVEIAGRIPVLVRGGGKASDKEILDRTVELMKQGAAGIVYGRNVIQHANPKGITAALMAIVHRNISADEAMKYINS